MTKGRVNAVSKSKKHSILLVGINAKYIHSNLAVRCLAKYLETHTRYRAEIAEFTINQEFHLIMREIYRKYPDILGFSCYIWNFDLVKKLTRELKKVLPETVIVWGGPEVSYDSEGYLGRYADHIICGEGEIAFAELVGQLAAGKAAKPLWQGVPTDLDSLPMACDDPETLRHRILYYESSRGCPFRCQYCLSSLDKTLHYRSLERTLADLDVFLSHKVPQVKLIDRTFNCDKARAKAIWRHLAEHDNGVTNFHFEIAGELLDEESLTLLSEARPGLFQLEIGVQTLNRDTLREICRPAELNRLFQAVRQLLAGGNIHLHLDLIAGLPEEDMDSFIRSFNGVYALAPHQLQLGFLKVLKGSGIYRNREKYSLLFTDDPPYEVLQTAWLSYAEILRLKRAEDMLERYYNSGRYCLECTYLISLFETPFAFYDALGAYYETQGLGLVSVSETDSYTVLYDFLRTLGRGDLAHFSALARFDFCAHKKPKKWPVWMESQLNGGDKQRLRTFFDAPDNRELFPQYEQLEGRQIARLLEVQVFPFHPLTGEKKQTALLFQYGKRDLFGNAEAIDVTARLYRD